MKIACDALRCIFQHVGNFAPDGGISQLITIRFSKGFQYNDGHFMSLHLIYNQLSQLNISYYHRRRAFKHSIVSSRLATLL